jgi:hypothetical protein
VGPASPWSEFVSPGAPRLVWRFTTFFGFAAAGGVTGWVTVADVAGGEDGLVTVVPGCSLSATEPSVDEVDELWPPRACTAGCVLVEPVGPRLRLTGTDVGTTAGSC